MIKPKIGYISGQVALGSRRLASCLFYTSFICLCVLSCIGLYTVGFGHLHALAFTGVTWRFSSDNVFIATPDSLLSERLVSCRGEIGRNGFVLRRIDISSCFKLVYTVLLICRITLHAVCVYASSTTW